MILLVLIVLASGCLPSLPELRGASDADPIAPNIAETDGFLRIIAINVGQGDATLLITPSLQTILIDGGRPEEGANSILPVFAELGIERLDYLIASHYDADHIGGIPEVIRGFDGIPGTDDDFTPRQALDRGGGMEDPVFESYLEAVGAARRTLQAGESLEIGDGVSLECVIGNGVSVTGARLPAGEDENANSLGLLLRFGAFRYFTAGDLPGGGPSGGRQTADMESLLPDDLGPVDLLHVSHHGSQTSTSASFIGRLSPSAALISVGDGNGYGHPHPDVLARLNRRGVAVYQTEAGNGGFLPQARVAGGAVEALVRANGMFTVDGDFYESHGNAP